MEKTSLRKRFFDFILQHIKSDECQVDNSIVSNYFTPEEERAEYRFVFNLKETLLNCGASRVDCNLLQANGFSTIRVFFYEEQTKYQEDLFQRRQSSWNEHDKIWKEYDEFAKRMYVRDENKIIDEVVCVFEMKHDNKKPLYSLKWEEIHIGGKSFKFSGKVRAWDKQFFISPICDDDSRIHCSDKDRMLLPVKSMYGFPVSEGILHSRIWQLPDKRIQGYDDLQLSTLFKEEGITLIGVRISKKIYLPSWYEFLTEKEVERLCPPYLRAEVIAYKDEDDGYFDTERKYVVFSFLARYSGTKEQWDELENTTASDLVVRFSFKPWERGDKELSYYFPLWVAAIYGKKIIRLSGERMDYSAIDNEVRAIYHSREGDDGTSYRLSARDEYLELCDAFGDEPDEDILDCLGGY